MKEVLGQDGSDQSQGLQGRELINDAFKRNKAEAEAEASWADESESIESINTVAAWCLIPNLRRAYDRASSSAGHFSRSAMWSYMVGGVVFTFFQAFMVTAMLEDVSNLITRGNAADDFVSLQLNNPSLPGREMSYCKSSNEDWENRRKELIGLLQSHNSSDDVDAHALANAFEGIYDSCIGNADDGQFFKAEFVVVMMMVIFFMLESHAENSELFLRAALTSPTGARPAALLVCYSHAILFGSHASTLCNRGTTHSCCTTR
eukprot:SAG31_NODE_4466_length_3209_cov_2.035370_3_plen_262_part_00